MKRATALMNNRGLKKTYKKLSAATQSLFSPFSRGEMSEGQRGVNRGNGKRIEKPSCS